MSIIKHITIFLLSCFCSTVYAEHTSIYKVQKPIKSVIDEYVSIPPIIADANIKVTAELYPKANYFKSKVELLQPYNRICSFNKTIEIWYDKNIIRSSVDINLNIKCKLIKRIVERKLENTILLLEQKFLQKKLALE